MNIEAPDFLAAADKLRTVHQLLTGAVSPLNENEQRVIGQYHEAGREYITSCLQIITDPAFADVFIRVQNHRDSVGFLVDHAGKDRRTQIKLAKQTGSGTFTIDYVILAYEDGSWTDTGTQYQNFQDAVRREHASPVQSDVPWIFEKNHRGTSQTSDFVFTGKRGFVPEDLLHEDILPEFIQNIIEMSGEMESCIRQDALEHAGIHTFNEEALLARVKGFQEASKILSGILPKKKT